MILRACWAQGVPRFDPHTTLSAHEPLRDRRLSRERHRAKKMKEALNQRFAKGHPSNSVASAGIVVFGFDHVAGDAKAPWNVTSWGQMGLTGPKRDLVLDSIGWISVSVMNRRAPWMYHDRHSEGVVAFVLSPDVVHAALRCSYPWDASTRGFTCLPAITPDPPESGVIHVNASDSTCLMGCGDASFATRGISGWCGTPSPARIAVNITPPGGTLHHPETCPYAPDALKSMMEKQLASADGFNGCDCCTYPGCPRYNELVLDPGTWMKRLPSTIEAIIFTADGKNVRGLEAHARRVHAHFRQAFSTRKHAQNVPLLSFDPRRPTRPFSVVDPVASQRRRAHEHALGSRESLVKLEEDVAEGRSMEACPKQYLGGAAMAPKTDGSTCRRADLSLGLINATFIHVPKDGGTTIESALGDGLRVLKSVSRHDSARMFAGCEGFSSHASFAVLREPVDRALSMYSYTLDDGEDGHTLEKHRWVGGAEDFGDFVARLASRSSEDVMADVVSNGCNDFYMPQSDYLVGADGTLLVTHLLCQERLDQDWAALQEALPALRAYPLPQDSQWRSSSHALEAGEVSASTRAMVYSKALFAEDLDLWTAVCNRSRSESSASESASGHFESSRRAAERVLERRAHGSSEPRESRTLRQQL